MSRKIKIVGVRRDKLDTKLAVLTFIALARELDSQKKGQRVSTSQNGGGANV